jgi:hypothetical protein
LIYVCSELTVLTAIIIIFCTVYLLFTFYFYYHAVLSKFKNRKKYYDEFSIVLSEEVIQILGRLSESKTKWEAYSQVAKGKDYYFLFDVMERFLLIQKEVFITEEDKLWFENKIIIWGVEYEMV